MGAPFWVLASDAPAALARFYSQVLNVPVESKGGVQQLTLSAGQQLAIYQPSKQRPQPAQHGRLALCLPSTNLERSLEHDRAVWRHRAAGKTRRANESLPNTGRRA